MRVVDRMIYFAPQLFGEGSHLYLACVLGFLVRGDHIVNAGVQGGTLDEARLDAAKVLPRFVVPGSR